MKLWLLIATFAAGVLVGGVGTFVYLVTGISFKP